jgi:hypothetical protein
LVIRVGVYHPDFSPGVGWNDRFLSPDHPGYTSFMYVVLFGMRLLEVIFFVGIVGSAVVVLITSFEDMHELFGSEEAPVGEKTSQP